MKEILNQKYGKLAMQLGDVVFQIDLLESRKQKLLEEINLLNKAMEVLPSETKKLDNEEVKSPGA